MDFTDPNIPIQNNPAEQNQASSPEPIPAVKTYDVVQPRRSLSKPAIFFLIAVVLVIVVGIGYYIFR